MMISHQHRFVYVSTPKAGTHTMYELLPRYGGVRYGGYHELAVPPRLQGYFRLTTCRDPLDRTVASWHSLLFHSPHRQHFLDLCGGDTFADYVAWMIQQPNDRRIQGHGYSCVSLQTARLDFRKFQAVIRMEHLEDDLALLPFINKTTTIPHELFRPHPRCDELLSPDLYRSLIHWLSPDYQALPYPKPELPA